MSHAKLFYGLALAAARKVDKEKAAQRAASLAASIAAGNGKPGIRKAAGLLAQTLSASAPQLPDGDGQSAGRDGESPDGWDRASRGLEKLQSLRTGSSKHNGSPAPVSVGGNGAAVPSAPSPSSIPDREAASISRGTLSGMYDAINVGAFSFSLYRSQHNVQLQVNQMRAPGNVGGLFSLEDTPPDTWCNLVDRGERVLPVWVLARGIDVEVQVGGGPEGARFLHATDVVPQIIWGM